MSRNSGGGGGGAELRGVEFQKVKVGLMAFNLGSLNPQGRMHCFLDPKPLKWEFRVVCQDGP